MKFPIFAGSALIALAGLLALTQPIRAAPTSAAASDLPVYGEPGEGRIRVETHGVGWHQPGIYWLPRDTPLVDFLKRAGPPDVITKDTYPWGVIVKRGNKHVENFCLQLFQRGEIKVTFVLEDGDIVQLVEFEL